MARISHWAVGPGAASASWRVVDVEGETAGCLADVAETSGGGGETAAMNAVRVMEAVGARAPGVHMSRRACIASADSIAHTMTD